MTGNKLHVNNEKRWLLFILCWLGIVIAAYQKTVISMPLYSLLLLLIWLAVFTISCYGIGSVLCYLCFREIMRDGAIIMACIALGAGVLMAGSAILGAIGTLHRIPLALIVTLGFCAGILIQVKHPLRVRLHAGTSLPKTGLMIAAVWTLLIVCTPSAFYDQLHYHLAFPFSWLRAGTITTFPRHAFSFFPANMGLLYVYGLGLFGPWAAQALHWWMGAYAVVGIGLLAAMFHGRKAGWWSALFFALTPSVLLSATWAAADLGIAAFSVAAWLLILAAWRREAIREKVFCWLLGGALVGIAAGCKISAITTVAFPLFIAVLLFPHQRGQARLNAAFFWLAGAGITFVPWLLRNALTTGNPFYPFFSSIFQWGALAREMAGSADYSQALSGVPVALPSAWRLLTFGTFAPTGVGGIIGPVYLIVLPMAAWAVIRKRKRGLWVLSLMGIVAMAGWSTSPMLGRYLLPALALLAVPLGIGWQALLEQVGKPIRLFLLSTLSILLAWNFILGNSILGMSQLSCTLGLESERKATTKLASYWEALPFVNEKLPVSAKLLLVGEARIMGIERDVVVEDPFHKPLLTELADQYDTVEAMVGRLQEMSITHVLINYAEARRQAAMNKRANYFEPKTQAGMQRLQIFMQNQLEKIYADSTVSIMLLKKTH